MMLLDNTDIVLIDNGSTEGDDDVGTGNSSSRIRSISHQYPTQVTFMRASQDKMQFGPKASGGNGGHGVIDRKQGSY